MFYHNILDFSARVLAILAVEHPGGLTSSVLPAEKGNRLLCAKCRKRSPRRVTEAAPWYCRK